MPIKLGQIRAARLGGRYKKYLIVATSPYQTYFVYLFEEKRFDFWTCYTINSDILLADI